MKLFFRRSVLALGLGLGVGSSFAAETKGEPKPAPPTAKAVNTSKEPAAKEKVSAESAPPKAAKRPLEKGMNEETIISIIGKPTEVKPMPAPEGKAEMWIYRQPAGQRTVQVVVGEREVPAYTGVGNANEGLRTAKELIYGTKHVTLYRVTSLLMFNGELTVARQTQEQSEVY